MRISRSFLGVLLVALVFTACGEDSDVPTGCVGPHCDPDDPGPGPGPGPAPGPVTLVFHSFVDNGTPLFKGDLNGGKTEINVGLVHHAGHIAVDGNKVYFASTAGLGPADLNAWSADLTGGNAQQINLNGFDAFGNIRDIDADQGTLVVVAEKRSNEFDARLALGRGTSGSFTELRDVVSSESAYFSGGNTFSSIETDGEQIVLFRGDGGMETVGDVFPDSANINVEGVMGDWVIGVGRNIIRSAPTLKPQVFAVNMRSGSIRTLSREGADDAVVCGNLIGVTYSSVSATRSLSLSRALASSAVRRMVLSSDGFIPGNTIEWRDIDGNIVDEADYGVPVIDPHCD